VRTVIILGAGASKGAQPSMAHRSPLDSDFLRLISTLRHDGESKKHVNVLLNYLADYPSLGGVIGSMEAFYSHFDVGEPIWNDFVRKQGRPYDYDRLRTAFYCCLLRLLRDADNGSTCGWHKKLFGLLKPGDAVVTFNYDAVADRALREAVDWSEDIYGYGLDGPPPRESSKRILLLKLHGSINWAKTSTGVAVDTKASNLYLPRDGHHLLLPGWNKGIEADPWRKLWRCAAQALREADRWIAIGYSLNPTDLKSRVLFEYAMYKLDSISVVDPDPAVQRRWADLVATTRRPISFQSFRDLGSFVA
jgi:hypothetical protein